MTPDIFHDCRLAMLDAFVQLGTATEAMSEGIEWLAEVHTRQALRQAEAACCAEIASEEALGACEKLRAIALKLSEFADTIHAAKGGKTA